MKRTRHSAEQIVGKLREADAMLAAGRSVAQIVQALGVIERYKRRESSVEDAHVWWARSPMVSRP